MLLKLLMISASLLNVTSAASIEKAPPESELKAGHLASELPPIPPGEEFADPRMFQIAPQIRSRLQERLQTEAGSFDVANRILSQRNSGRPLRKLSDFFSPGVTFKMAFASLQTMMTSSQQNIKAMKNFYQEFLVAAHEKNGLENFFQCSFVALYHYLESRQRNILAYEGQTATFSVTFDDVIYESNLDRHSRLGAIARFQLFLGVMVDTYQAGLDLAALSEATRDLFKMFEGTNLQKVLERRITDLGDPDSYAEILFPQLATYHRSLASGRQVVAPVSKAHAREALREQRREKQRERKEEKREIEEKARIAKAQKTEAQRLAAKEAREAKRLKELAYLKERDQKERDQKERDQKEREQKKVLGVSREDSRLPLSPLARKAPPDVEKGKTRSKFADLMGMIEEVNKSTSTDLQGSEE